MNLLNATFLSAFVGVAILILLPIKHARFAKWIALLSSVAGFIFALAAFFGYDRSQGVDPACSFPGTWRNIRGRSFRFS